MVEWEAAGDETGKDDNDDTESANEDEWTSASTGDALYW